MSTDFSPALKRELLDDFYTECDELLVSMRGDLGQLEDAAEQRAGTVAEALFRHVHSMKGISAIVGLRPAEELAHAMEDLLRGRVKGQTVFPNAWIDVLSAATQRLEQIVVAHRLGKPLPEIGEALAQLRGLPSSAAELPRADAPMAVRTEGESSVPEPVAKNVHRYRVSFVPSKERNERGINVGSVRERLGDLGTIESVAPSVRDKGSIVFEFIVLVPRVPADFSAWEADGIHFEPLADLAANRGSQSPWPAASQSEAAEALSIAPSHIVRVDLARLDELMRITGEMVILRSRLAEKLRGSSAENPGLKEIDLGLGRSLREMRAALAKVRTVPIAEIFSRMPFVVRDLARDSGKKVRVVLEGRHTEVDKFIVERLKEPLLHLVRNAFAHGIELPDQRVAAGKLPEATLTLSATARGQSVTIQIRDDGRGVDLDAVAKRAARFGLPVPQPLDLSGALAILCAPGFSTKDEADLAAGRGVGMAVVANTVRELGGTLALESTLGAGTQFTLILPVSLSIIEAIVVTVGGETCAVPQAAVEEIFQIASSEVRGIQQTEVVPYRGGLLPLVRLHTLFRFSVPPAPGLTLLVVRGERGVIGVAVDRVLSQREIVVRPLLDPLVQVSGISGATELGDGRPLLVLDPATLTRGVVRPTNNADILESPLAKATAS